MNGNVLVADKMREYLKSVLENMPADWLNLTTHRLDIYNEKLAKVEFTKAFESLYDANNFSAAALYNLPTAYDYIRLGHPLSCVLEWAFAKSCGLPSNHVISFSSHITPILAVLRKNLLAKKKTHIYFKVDLPKGFDEAVIKKVYGYDFELKKVTKANEIPSLDGTTIFLNQANGLKKIDLNDNIDFYISAYANLGSILVLNGDKNKDYVSEIQHVRRRETIAMTPADCQTALQSLIVEKDFIQKENGLEKNKAFVQNIIKEITGTSLTPAVGSSGLSIQYAIMMGLVDHAIAAHPTKDIKFIVPPNCYGGTNDQARRVAACSDRVEVLDLPVDSGNDMVQSLEIILEKIAKQDALAYIIAEIPTNPRVEVPDLIKLKETLATARKTSADETAIDPVFILDQTFCPNVQFLGEGGFLSTVRTISYSSGSKFPSGGKCNSGYCVGNDMTADLMEKIDLHLHLCDNEATDLQYEILAEQMPSMLDRIAGAYRNTRAFVTYIQENLPDAKINFVSEELATQGFTPSVFSLDLPTKGNTEDEKETYKRALNHKLISMMITEIPKESKYCVSYGQLKGCYWTIPATSTQGTTKEGDKDYIARVALSADMDLDLHMKVFKDFVDGI